MAKPKIIHAITEAELQMAAQAELGRELNTEELQVVEGVIDKVLYGLLRKWTRQVVDQIKEYDARQDATAR